MTGTHGPPAIACYAHEDRQSRRPRHQRAVLITVACARLVTYAINGLFEIDRPGDGAGRAVSLASSRYSATFVDKERFGVVARHISPRSVLMLYKGIEGL